MTKKLLIPGGSHSDIPQILAAQKLGWFVVTIGNRPHEMGHRYSNKYIAADYSDKEAVLKIALDESVEAICPCCNDFSALSSAYVAEKLGFQGHDNFNTSMIIHHKDKYRNFASKNEILTPSAKGYEDITKALNDVEKFQFPLIIKPVDLSGGKGMTVLQDKKNLRKSLEKAFNASKAGRIVIEEFIEGTRHGMSAFIVNKKIAFHFTDNEYYYMNPFLVSAASAPGSVPDSAIDDLIKYSEKIAQLLNLVNGIFHIQFILKDSKPYIIEICRRPPGDLYVKFVEYATGLDYPELIVRSFTGQNISALEQHPIKGFFTRHCIMGDQTGVLKDIVYDNSVKNNIIDEFLWWEKGESITDIMTDKHGIVFLKFETKEEMTEKTKIMQDLIKVKVD